MLALVATVFVRSGDAQSDHPVLLSPGEIVEQISGKWSVPFLPEGASVYVSDCELEAISIWLREEDGELWYYSQREGTGGKGLVERVPVRTQRFADGTPAPWLLIRYDNEQRMTEAGEPVAWRLLMTSADRFTWQRLDWQHGNFAPVRIRCEAASAFF